MLKSVEYKNIHIRISFGVKCLMSSCVHLPARSHRDFATVNLLLGVNLGKIRPRIPARFWPPRFVLPGKICGRIAPRFWPPGFLLLSKNLGKFHGRIPARFWPPGISLPGEIPARKKNPGGQNLAWIPVGFVAGSRQDPGPYFTRAYPLLARSCNR